MVKNSFDIIDAAKKGYIFLAQEWKYVFRLGMPALIASILIGGFVQYFRSSASIFEQFLWEIPSTMLFAWLVFMQTRLIFFNERIEKLDQDVSFLKARAKCLKASVILTLLFHMGLIIFLKLLERTAPPPSETGIQQAGNLPLLLMLSIVILWFTRFSLLPLTAAIDYPLKSFVQSMRGMMISLRLIALTFMVLFPVFFLFQIILSSFLPAQADPMSMNPYILLLIQAPASFIMVIIINACFAMAVKEMLFKK